MTDLQTRIAEVKAKLPIASVMDRHIKLSGGASARNRRVQCPFHGSKSASLSVATDKGYAHCFGCQWHGDVIKFTADFLGLSFLDALEILEGEAGIAQCASLSEGSGTVRRARNPSRRQAREVELIEPIDMARWIWRKARADVAAVRRYFVGRGIDAAVLTDDRLVEFKFHGLCPITPWPVGGKPDAGPVAPAIIAMVRKPELQASGFVEFVPVAAHITFLNPDGTGTMKRRKPWAKAGDPEPYFPKRKMLGPVAGGCVLLGRYSRDAHLFVGEGNETVFGGIQVNAAGAEAIGIATLSLETLQGQPRLWKGGVLPLFDIVPDPERGPFVIPRHLGRVTGLIDSDMKPLRGFRDQNSGLWKGVPVVERKGGQIVNRAITGAERAQICGTLFVKGWRSAGARDVKALRAPIGMDFNDVAKGLAT